MSIKDLSQDIPRLPNDPRDWNWDAACRDELVEYPDFVLSLGPRGGVKCERC